MSLIKHYIRNLMLGVLSAPGGKLSSAASAAISLAGVPQGPKRVVAKTVADIITAANAASTNAVHTVIDLVPGQTYNVPSGTTITLDSAWVEIEGNYSVISCAAWGSTTGSMIKILGNNSGIHDYTKYVRLKRTLRNVMLVNDPAKYVGTDDGPDLLTFDTDNFTVSPSANSNRVFIERVIFCGGRRNVVYGSASYFIKYIGCEFSRAFQCFGTLASGVLDFAEQIEFDDGCLIAENGTIWGPAAYGQVYAMFGGSIDYNLNIMKGSNHGTTVMLNGTHVEFSYGGSAGQTQEPVAMVDAGGLFAGSCRWFYTGGADPQYATHILLGNSSNKIRLNITKAYRLGRTSRTSYDAFARGTSNPPGQVALQFDSELLNPADYPAMTIVAEARGSYGMVWGGLSDPANGVLHLIGYSGTAVAPAVRTATTNGISRPVLSAEAGGGSVPMIELRNSGAVGSSAKYYFCFPKYERGRKQAWAAFFNAFALTSGSVVIREWRVSPTPVYNGTALTWALTAAGASYHAGTVMLTAASMASGTDWKRYDHRDMAASGGVSAGSGGNGTMGVQDRSDLGALCIVEVDVTNAAGYLYNAMFGNAPIGVMA